MMSNTGSQPASGSSTPAAAGTEPKTAAAGLAQAKSGCSLIVACHAAYEQYLVDHVAPDYMKKLTSPELAERICRLKRLARPTTFHAFVLLWKQSREATPEEIAALQCPSAVAGVMTTHRLVQELIASDPIERVHRTYRRQVTGKLSRIKRSMYRQRANRLVNAAEIFGLLATKDAIDEASGKPTKLLFFTAKFNEMMLTVGQNAAMLAATSLQGGNAQAGNLPTD